LMVDDTPGQRRLEDRGGGVKEGQESQWHMVAEPEG